MWYQLFRYKYLQPKIDSGVISGGAVEYVDMDVRVTFGDSRSNGSGDIRGADFVSNERTNMTEAYRINAFRLLKKQLKRC